MGFEGEDRFREPLTKVGLLSAKRFEIEDAGSAWIDAKSGGILFLGNDYGTR